MNLNLLVINGNLTRDVETKQVGSGLAVFSIAVNKPPKNGVSEVFFLECNAWGKTAEFASKYLKKGSAVLLQGRLEIDTWEDSNGGGKRSKPKMTVDSIQFCGGGGGNFQRGNNQGQGQDANAENASTAKRTEQTPAQSAPKNSSNFAFGSPQNSNYVNSTARNIGKYTAEDAEPPF